MRAGARVLATFVFSSVLISASFGQGASTPSQLQDPTAQAPATPPQGTPPALPKSESQPKAPNSSGRTHVRVIQPFTGTVIAHDTRYVLRAGDLEHKLDAQSRVAKYVGQKVKITGSLDKANNIIHIQTIEEISDQLE
ncbi:MAG: hypothetical protein ACHP8A_01860 [Terriglobales bacterium]|jgi:hypothetical protein